MLQNYIPPAKLCFKFCSIEMVTRPNARHLLYSI